MTSKSSKLTPLEIMMGIAVPLVWGMGLVFAKAAIEQFPPILLMGFRFTLTAMVLVWFVKLPLGQLRKLCGIAMVAAAIQYSFTYTGLSGIDVSIAALIVQLEVPFLVLLGALLLGEQPTLQKWFGITIAFLGVFLIAGQIRFGGEWLSIALVISGAFTWALGQVFIRKLKDIDGLTVTAWIAVFAAPQLFFMSFLFESNHMQAIVNSNWKVWGAVIYLGLIMTAFGYYLWNTLIRRHDVGRVAPFLLLLPIFSVFGGVVFLGDALTLGKLLGGAVVLIGVSLISFERQKNAKPDMV